MEYIYICPKCKSTFGAPNQDGKTCPDCHCNTVYSGYSGDDWYALSRTERDKKKAEIEGDTTEVHSANSSDSVSSTSQLALIQFRKKKAELEANGEILDESKEAGLFAQCIELQVLKSPASAVFPPLDEMIVNGHDGQYVVSGFVDSQNSYGAMIRSKFTYTVSKTLNDEWVCSDKFVSSASKISAEVGATVMSHTILYWVLGIIGTGFLYLIIRLLMDF